MPNACAGGSVQPGDVFVSLNHVFDDGGTAPRKFLVIYGSRKGNVLYFLTTSQEKFARARVEGCKHERNHFTSNFYILPPKQKSGKFKGNTRKGFTVPTWIILEPLFIGEAEFTERMTANKCYRDFALAQHEFDGVRTCFTSSPEFSPVHAEF